MCYHDVDDAIKLNCIHNKTNLYYVNLYTVFFMHYKNNVIKEISQ